MPILRSIASAVPAHAVSQAALAELARFHFAPAFPDIDRYMVIFRNTRIETRYLAAPPAWFTQPHSFQESNSLYIEQATALGRQAITRCLANVGLDAEAIDHIIWISTTGLATPSPDALLIGRLGMRPTTRRTPIWGLGCAGGVAGLARASEYVRAFPHHRALLVAVELCSLTFQWDDRSRRNLVAASLFADGAAAVLVEGAELARPAQPALRVLATQSLLWPDTRSIMGWDIVNSGMQVVFSARIPALIQATMGNTIATFLAQHGLTKHDIRHWILHPGGARVIDAYREALGVTDDDLRHTADILRCYGNMSSATILFVLQAFLAEGAPAAGEYGILAVLGPGFSCELALVQGQ
ncbi:MAG TPA: 3-oxoacyl-[acyl-carrier-protein] synthase III C-terminal domain-containing protein [Roseiflexaceae bacterium]|nr:3-oxoacyl-[acyl-carrier-protein] synthase III C-terminal domain-containing protein [Roseiflexaceae bacterium]HMP40031.1 3-oxoacyl-[acyl-carrier-protein] synthase III C-terminal domain-containing protein [Roseiflexaceae bacterium]